MNFSFSSFFRNMLHIIPGGTAFYWILGLFHVTPVMIHDAVGAISTIVAVGATIWSQIRAFAQAAPPAPPAK